MKKEIITINSAHEASLTCYLWENDEEYRTIEKRPAVIVIPGGGYEMCSAREADPVATAYFQAGYQTFVLRYSVKENRTWPNPLNDYEDAIRLIRDNCEEWKVYADKIAVVGFSAGGHLAGAAATMSKNRPNAAILGYPVLNKESIGMWNTSAPDVISHIDKDTCPCFLFHTRSDRMVSVKNTIEFISTLEETGITFETHIYSFGPHGFSSANQMMQGPVPNTITDRAAQWVSDSIGFLQEIFGTFGYLEMNKPLVGKYAFPEKSGIFSIDNTVASLLENPKSMGIVAPFLEEINKANVSENETVDEAEASKFLSLISLRDLITHTNMSPNEADIISKKLEELNG